MKKSVVAFAALVLFALASTGSDSVASPHASGAAKVAGDTETLVLLRHGEKTKLEFGQLSETGLRRALALPDVLIGKYGKPDFIFAPDPAKQIHDRDDGKDYSYVRPLATIEPTAIKLGMPVNTQFGFTDIQHLQSELAQPTYTKATVFVAWEHKYLDDFARNVVKADGGDEASVPAWPGSDYDSIFVIRIQHTGDKATAIFSVDHEGLNDKLTDK